jgi:hypothetical protein
MRNTARSFSTPIDSTSADWLAGWPLSVTRYGFDAGMKTVAVVFGGILMRQLNWSGDLCHSLRFPYGSGSLQEATVPRQ